MIRVYQAQLVMRRRVRRNRISPTQLQLLGRTSLRLIRIQTIQRLHLELILKGIVRLLRKI